MQGLERADPRRGRFRVADDEPLPWQPGHPAGREPVLSGPLGGLLGPAATPSSSSTPSAGPPDPAAGPIDVPLTDGHIDQLRRCSYDLRVTNINRSDRLDTATAHEAAEVRAAIDANLAAVHVLEVLFVDYAQATSD